MISDNEAELLAVKVASPPYAAVIECTPSVSADVTSIACPDPLTRTVARTVFPSVKVIVPVGVPAPGNTAFTVAVNVTVVPALEGFKLEIRVVDVFALLTV